MKDFMAKDKKKKANKKTENKVVKKKSDKIKVSAAARNLEKKIAERIGDIEYPVQMSDPKDCVSTGLLNLDLIFSGGYRRGRMYTHLGLSESGKSTTIQAGISAAQKAKLKIFHLDPESGSSAAYMKRHDIIVDSSYKSRDGTKGYYYLNPENGDECYQMMFNLLDLLPNAEKGLIAPPSAIFFLDGYDAMSPADIKVDQNPIGAAARMHSRYQKLIRAGIRKTGACLVATNQLRMKIMSFGDPYTDGGGLATAYYADVKTRISRRKEKKDGKSYISIVKIRCTKNKTCSPFHEFEARLINGKGFDKLHDRLTFLTATKQIGLERGKYIIDGKKLAYGAARKLMKEKGWIKYCGELRRDFKTYKQYFEEDDLMDF